MCSCKSGHGHLEEDPVGAVGALPEMLNTAWGSLSRSLRLQKDDHLLMRGGMTSVGLAAAVIAKQFEGDGCSDNAQAGGRGDVEG